MYHDTLVVKNESCPPSCALCVEACRARNGKTSPEVIQKVDLPEQNFHSALLCNQCSQPECASICPTGAIDRMPGGGVSVQDESCIGCGLCTLVCPYGGVYLDGHR